MKNLISTEQNADTIRQVLELLAKIPKRLEWLSKPLSVSQLNEPLGVGKRSFLEDLAHLLNSEARTSEAIHLALLLKEPAFLEIHPERQWGKLLHYEHFGFSELLVYFSFRRKLLLSALTPLTEKAWARTVREEGKQRRESVYWKARALALHELHHLDILEARLATLSKPKRL